LRQEARVTPLPVLRQRLETHCVAILSAYRKHCTAPNSNMGQLILPEALKLLPLYVCSMLKTPALRAGAEVGADERVAAIFRLLGAASPVVMPLLFPRVVAVHDLGVDDDGAGAAAVLVNGLPPLMRPSIERFKVRFQLSFILQSSDPCVGW
jgi:protein transport protein SEC24